MLVNTSLAVPASGRVFGAIIVADRALALLLLGTEAPVMTPNGVDFSFLLIAHVAQILLPGFHASLL